MPATPRLVGLQTAVPDHVLDQADAARRAAHLFEDHPEILRLLPVFENTGIERRYSCVPINGYTRRHGWKERNELYLENAVALLEKVALASLEETGLEREDLDAMVVASTTGIATPSLDALMIERLGLK